MQKMVFKYISLFLLLLLSGSGEVLAQAPNISYTPSSNAYPVGSAITNWVPTNIGGAINSSSTATSVSGPSGMGINPLNNDLYVTQFGGPTVTYYNTSLTYQGALGAGYTDPDGVAFDASGNAYVADPGANKIWKITSGGVQSTFISGLTAPYGVGVDASGNIYVANTNAGNIKKYSSAGTLLLTITTNISTPVDVKVDASGNIYSLNQGTNNVTKYNSAGTYQSIFASGFTTPWALAIDASNNIYVGDAGNNAVDIYNSASTLQSTKNVTDPEGLAIDAGGDLFVASYSANKIIEFPANNGYTISPTLPAGLSFDSTTGTISGTPTATSSATVYTVVGSNSSGSSTTYITITCYSGVDDWKGTTSTAWGTGTNWSTGVVPGSTILARIGVNAAYTLTRMPVVGTSTTVGSIQMGESGALAPSISVSTGITLTDNGLLTYQSDANSSVKNYTATLSGLGSIATQGIAVNANTATGTAYAQTLSSSVTSLTISGNIGLTSTYTAAKAYNAAFNITGGTVAVSGAVQTINGTSSTSTLNVANATLQLAGASALSGLSATGTNTITFNGSGATVQYSGTAQTVYTSASITGLSSGVSYTNIGFSGSGIKTALSGNLNITGNFANTLANDVSNYVALNSPTVNFNGAAQSLAGGAGSGTTFYNATFSGGGTKTMASGLFNVDATGILTLSGSSTLATGGFLTLNSTAASTATIAQIPTGSSVSGSVTAQRYITGGTGYRTYRLISSPVYAATVSTNNIYSINYLGSGMYLTGSTGVGGGFDKAGNPTLYLYREDQTPSNTTFTNGNFWGISAINNTPAYNYYLNGGATSYNIPVGNGMMFFFRGNRAAASLSTETLTSYTLAPTVTLSTTGTLTQGQVIVHNWYTPASGTIGYTGSGVTGNYPVRGFNLIGNPYPSSIDWSLFSNTNSAAAIYGVNVSPTIWTFDPFTKNYATYNAVTGISTGNGGNIIESGQGFFVLATNTSPTLTFNEAAKSSTQATGSHLLMARQLSNFNTSPKNAYSSYMRLKLITDSANFSDVVIGFNPASSAVFNPNVDSKYIAGMGNAQAISEISSDDIQAAVKWVALPKNKQNLVLPLKIWTAASGQYTLQRAELTQLPDLYQAWLMDRYNKDSVDIRKSDAYIFNVNTADSNSYGSNRFQVVIRRDPARMVRLLDFTGSKVFGGSQLMWKTENEADYTNFELQRSIDGGKSYLVIGGQTSDSTGNYSFVDTQPVKGANMYKLKITDLDGGVTYSNVVTLLYANIVPLAKTGISVYPNPASTLLNLQIAAGFNSNPDGYSSPGLSYDVQITNITGTVVGQTSITGQSWQTNVSSLLPGTYIIQVTNKVDNSVVGRSTFIKL